MPLADKSVTGFHVLVGLKTQGGRDLTQEHETGFKWCRRTAEQGNVFAQRNLGVMYAFGMK